MALKNDVFNTLHTSATTEQLDQRYKNQRKLIRIQANVVWQYSNKVMVIRE